LLGREDQTVVRESDAFSIDRVANTRRRSLSTPVTSPRITVVFRCFLRMLRIGEAICPGLKTDVAT